MIKQKQKIPIVVRKKIIKKHALEENNLCQNGENKKILVKNMSRYEHNSID